VKRKRGEGGMEKEEEARRAREEKRRRREVLGLQPKAAPPRGP
jgi:hypothetical protein